MPPPQKLRLSDYHAVFKSFRYIVAMEQAFLVILTSEMAQGSKWRLRPGCVDQSASAIMNGRSPFVIINILEQIVRLHGMLH